MITAFAATIGSIAWSRRHDFISCDDELYDLLYDFILLWRFDILCVYEKRWGKASSLRLLMCYCFTARQSEEVEENLMYSSFSNSLNENMMPDKYWRMWKQKLTSSSPALNNE